MVFDIRQTSAGEAVALSGVLDSGQTNSLCSGLVLLANLKILPEYEKM